MLSESKSAQVNLRLAPALKARAEKAAAADHRSLTSLIEKLLSDYLQARGSLQKWHQSARHRFEDLVLKHGESGILTPRSFRVLSFSINTSEGSELDPCDVLPAIQSHKHRMRNVFHNPHLFHSYTRQELAPYSASATESGEGELLESSVFPDIASVVDFWRIAPSGLASHIRPYNEDRASLQNVIKGRKWFWPYQLIRELYEFVLHAHLLSERFRSAESVEFRCEWWGLQSREIADPESELIWTEGKVAREDHRVTTGEWAIGDLIHQPDIVSSLAAPVLRLFDPTFDCSPEWVGQQTTRFKKFG